MLVLGMAVPSIVRAWTARQRHEVVEPVFEPVAAAEVPHAVARDLEEVRPTVALLRDVAVFEELGDVGAAGYAD